ncbi:MAG: LPS-assembly protein LptD [Lentisphaeria bacterium]|nr:LPS-assembly protein LptD [Lentisphaeria bacterium]
MKNTAGFLILAIILISSTVSGSPFSVKSLKNTVFKDIKAEHWNIVGKNIMIRGNIRVPFNDMELVADQAVINTENQDIEAAGHVRLLRWHSRVEVMTPEELARLRKAGNVVAEIQNVKGDIFGGRKLQVKVTIPGESLYASRISGNLGSGYFRMDDFSLRSGMTVCRAKSAERRPDGVIEAKDAEVSSCSFLEHNNAHHSITAAKIILTPRETEFYTSDSIVKRPGDYEVSLVNGAVRIAGIPVFWLPVLYKPEDFSLNLFSLRVGKSGDWGFYALMSKTFHLSDYPGMKVRLHGDYYANRGFGFGLSGKIVSDQSRTDFFAYGLHDIRPYDSDDYDDYRLRVPHSRYDFRISNITHITPRLDFRGAFEYSSDLYFVRDFFSIRYNANPHPATFAALEQQFDHFSASVYYRPRTNDFYTVSERLPEVRLDIPRQEIFGTNIYYQGDMQASHNSMQWIKFDYDKIVREDAEGNLRETLIKNKLKNYSAARFDTTHFLYFPIRLDWLTIVPRAGFKLTAYSDTSENAVSSNDLLQMFMAADPENISNLRINNYDSDGESKVRTVGELGVEASTKIHRTWSNIRIPAMKVDGLRHILRPYLNYTYLDNPSVSRNHLLYFDDLDRIEKQHFIRVGMENRLQTRDSDRSLRNIVSMENYFDFYFDTRDGYGNVEKFNRLGNFCTVLTASPLKGLTFSTSFNIDLGDNNGKIPEADRRGHAAGRPGLNAKWLNRWDATLSYEIMEDVTVNLSYLYKRPYSSRSAYSMGSTLHQFDAGGYFDKYFDDHDEIISAGITMPLSSDRRLKGAVKCSYDIQDGSYTAIDFMLVKTFHCWELAGMLSFSRDVDDEERDWDTSFSVQVRLMGLEAPLGGRKNAAAANAVQSYNSKTTNKRWY